MNSISDSPVGGGVITTLLRSADGSRPGLAENSRYSFFKWMNGQLRQAGRFAINCNSLVIAVALTAVYAVD